MKNRTYSSLTLSTVSKSSKVKLLNWALSWLERETKDDDVDDDEEE